MDIIAALTPKNMTVREVARVQGTDDVVATTYVFNSKEYTHIGTWPPKLGMAGFHVPIATAEIIETNQDITRQLRRFAGPRHIVTPETVRHALGRWSWRFRIIIITGRVRLVTYPVFVVPETVPAVRITDVLGHVSVVFCAK